MDDAIRGVYGISDIGDLFGSSGMSCQMGSSSLLGLLSGQVEVLSGGGIVCQDQVL